MTPTAARPARSQSSHWYTLSGQPCYEVPYADPLKGMRPTTLSDARKLNLLPSVTTILRVLDKPSLTDWLIEQAVLAVATTERGKDEGLDEFIHRVMQLEKQQDSEAQKARNLGTEIHDELAAILGGMGTTGKFIEFTVPAMSLLAPLGKPVMVEMVLVGAGYAGKTDLVMSNDSVTTLVDFKTAKKIPKEAYPEHRLQLAAYAKALGSTGNKQIETANLYISTSRPGDVALRPHKDWQKTFDEGFSPLIKYWNWVNQYKLSA